MQTEQRRRVNFVAAHPDPVEQPPATVDVVPIQVTDTSGAWAGVASPTRDSISAVDRAQAFRLRMMPIYVTVGLVAIAVTVLYAIIAIAADVAAPLQLDKFLVFLGVLSAGLFLTHTRANRTDYEHTHAGVERLRVRTAAAIRREELRAELELRQMALAAQLRLLDARQNATDAPRRAIGVRDD